MTRAVTVSGRIVDLLDPQPDTICVDDVAWHLAHETRWNGQLGMLSVAKHSIAVARIVEPITPLTRLLALLHDGEEYLYGDVVSPAKDALAYEATTCAEGDHWVSCTGLLAAAIYTALAGRLPTTKEQEAISVADREVAKWEAWTLGGVGWKNAIERVAPGYFDGCRGAALPPAFPYEVSSCFGEGASTAWINEYEKLKRV
ncbi:MAG: hypothetical protein IT381_13875 [Deltaproteobacteria bacterium]|nr:hypothetical protein [Deltaproteobacteria bacterium]